MIRGIRLRLALALLVVAAGAMAVAYAVVVPTLEERLVQAKLDQLEKDARLVAANVPGDLTGAQTFTEVASSGVGARIVIYQVVERRPPFLAIRGDSRLDSSRDVERNVVARNAALSGRLQRGTAVRGERRFADVAIPVEGLTVVLLSDSLADPLSSVRFVRRRLLVAGLIALGVALALGYGAASLHARRIRRLERAAERIAGGRFDEPVVDRGNDELGQLASAFERMRNRLENLDRARREFIANASHELRTPLFSLGGFLELLDDEDLDEPTRQEFVTTMREQVERLTKLATDLLDLSRLDAGRIRVESNRVDLHSVAQVLADEFRAVAERREHDLEVEVDGEPVALGDELRVLQIGRALVDNALLHTPTGSRIRIHVWVEDRKARLSVTDDGPGVPAEHVDHIFDRFYRAETELASGSGLGLAIARELAAVMGGTVTLESRPGLTVATIALRAHPAACPADVFT
ncbi:MAG: HAMP domain-containing protein [Actinobacteria bacterium]|nr:HAMP domain-containing protein [Actinomycetota bacterium]